MFVKLSNPLFLNVLACLVFFLALTNVSGFLVGKQSLSTFGHSIGFSPMPLPFRELEPGSENMNVVFSITLNQGGTIKTYSGNDLLDILSLHKRPHRTAIPFFTLSNYFVVLPNDVKRKGFEYICKKMGGGKMTAYINYEIHKYTYTVTCKN